MRVEHSFFRLTLIGLVVFLPTILLFRPLTTIYTSNDTSRYVSEFNAFCMHRGLEDFSLNFYFQLLSVSCDSVSGFLFLSALLPLLFIVFIPVSRRNLLLALGMVFSFYMVEFSGNALRQGAAASAYLIAVLIQHPIFGIGGILRLSGLLLHPSVLILVALEWCCTWRRLAITLVAILAFCLIFYFYSWQELVILDRLRVLSEIHGTSKALSFDIFVFSLLAAMICARIGLEYSEVAQEEKVVLLFSLALVAVFLLLIPAMLYRLSGLLFVFWVTIVLRSQGGGKLILPILMLAMSFAHLGFISLASSEFVLASLPIF